MCLRKNYDNVSRQDKVSLNQIKWKKWKKYKENILVLILKLIHFSKIKFNIINIYIKI